MSNIDQENSLPYRDTLPFTEESLLNFCIDKFPENKIRSLDDAQVVIGKVMMSLVLNGGQSDSPNAYSVDKIGVHYDRKGGDSPRISCYLNPPSTTNIGRW